MLQPATTLILFLLFANTASSFSELTPLTVRVAPNGSYQLAKGGTVLLESAEAGPCGVQRNGQWCRCSDKTDISRIAQPLQGCVLIILNRSSAAGKDSLGAFTRTELQWAARDSQSGPPLLVTAVRTYVPATLPPPPIFIFISHHCFCTIFFDITLYPYSPCGAQLQYQKYCHIRATIPCRG